MAERPLDQAIDLLQAAGFVGLTRDNTTTSWIGLVIGTKLHSGVDTEAVAA
jgi:hypothetical protein